MQTTTDSPFAVGTDLTAHPDDIGAQNFGAPPPAHPLNIPLFVPGLYPNSRTCEDSTRRFTPQIFLSSKADPANDAVLTLCHHTPLYVP
jgi:hypothetical protein